MYCPYCSCKDIKVPGKCSSCGRLVRGVGEKSDFACEKCGKDVSAEDKYCWHCGNNVEETVSDESVISEVESMPETEFGTLLSYGKLISGFGWLLVISGPIAFFVLSIVGGKNGLGIGVGIGLALVIIGASYVLAGQTISCFVSIEKYNRQTTHLLKVLLKKTH